ncbi:MAG: PEP-CTERM sorting domain-containing protein [Deltaproteobacteria bacterium]|nr:PEP-CTERM sorting domain-containing protein [Deltaproteobacteria bacterium]
MTDRTMNLVAADTRCFLEEFSTQIALDTAYPSMAGDNYEFRFSQADLAQVFLPGEFDAPAPLASIDYVNPTDNATVPEDENLNVAWLFDKGTSNCSRPGDCGDGIVSLLEDTLSDDILAASPPLAIEATGYLFPSTALTAGKQVDVVSAIYTGVVSDQLTDGTSDMYTLTAANTDVNEITINVPEPSSTLLAGFALTAAIGLGRWRREA